MRSGASRACRSKRRRAGCVTPSPSSRRLCPAIRRPARNETVNADDRVDLSDDAFEEYLNGGSALSRAYGALASQKVPQKVESSVLRRARALASLRELLQTQTWVRWSTPVALAACTLVMIAVLIQ